MMNDRMMIGIDGGGTKTEFLLFSEQGNVKEHLILGGTNLNSCGREQTFRVLKTGIDELLAICDSVDGIFAGIAGTNSGDNRKILNDFLAQMYPTIKTRCETDIFNVIGCALIPERCTVVISGTGSVAYAKVKNGLHRIGGWGYRFDNAGSGYDMGREAIAVALAQRDGIGPDSLVTELVEERLGGTVIEFLNLIYQKDNHYIASFAPLVFEADTKGDTVAHDIIEKNAKRLSFLIRSARQQYEVGNRVILSGGIVTKQRALVQMVQKDNPALDMEVPRFPQVLGACVQCCAMCSLNYELLIEQLHNGYEQLLLQEKEG